ncbi:hypothetical protein [Aeromicrobium sp. Root495]|uniref:hypothetical protein n=1 Tax=Aeromicrobium sp. Root495 TaxID=1736550 RepID=UPI000A93ACB3|nr:hypothetical protein [Aeromicrobium sp. Root495]
MTEPSGDVQSERLAIAAMLAIANGAGPDHESVSRILDMLGARIGPPAAMAMVTEIAVGLVLGAADILDVDGRGLLVDAFRTLADVAAAE